MDGQIQNGVNPYVGLSQEALDKLLLQAIKYEGILAVELLIKNGANIDAADDFGQTMLMIAIHYNSTTIADFLIRNGANIEAIDEDGSNALMCAVYSGDMFITDLLIKRGANLERIDNEGSTALMIAARDCGFSMPFRLLCEITPEQRHAFAMTSQENYTLVEKFNQALKDNTNKLYDIIMPTWNMYANSMFNEFPADVIKYIQNFEIALQEFPTWYQHRIEVDLERTLDFVSKKKKVNPINYFVPQAVLIQKKIDKKLLKAINNQDFEKVELWIEKGGNANATRDNGFTMLRDAICYNRRTTVKMVDLLIKKGANISLIDKLGMTALKYALSMNDTSTVFRLLCEMTLEQRLTFAITSQENNMLLNQHHNILFSWNVFVNNMLTQHPAELLIQSVQSFPDWYQHRILAMFDFKSVNYLYSEKTLSAPVIFSKKRKLDSDLDESQFNKKERIGEYGNKL